MLSISPVSTTRPFFTGYTPLPPSVNASYRPGSRSRPIIATEALKQFKKDAALTLSQGYHDWSIINQMRRTTEPILLSITIRVYVHKLLTRDLDNCIKAVQDAVFARLQINDKHVVDLHACELLTADEQRVEVEVACLLTGE